MQARALTGTGGRPAGYSDGTLPQPTTHISIKLTTSHLQLQTFPLATLYRVITFYSSVAFIIIIFFGHQLQYKLGF
jgi:hypothetical protein